MRGLKMGALDFITKPFEADVMLGRIEKVLQMEDMRRNILGSSKKDLLTDLWNAEYMAAEVDSRIRSDSDGSEMVMVDIDGFGNFLMEQGNSYANGVIIKFTEALRMTALSGSVLCRSGEDEFLIYIPQVLSEAELMSYCEEICTHVMDEANRARNGGDALTASVAAVFIPKHGRDYDEQHIVESWSEYLDNHHFRIVTLDSITNEIVDIILGSGENTDGNAEGISW